MNGLLSKLILTLNCCVVSAARKLLVLLCQNKCVKKSTVLPLKCRKRSFLLIEILIAITLISLCGVSLLAPSYKITQKKIQKIESIQLNHFSKENYLRLKMLILEGVILLPKEASTFSGIFSPVEVAIGSEKKNIFNCSYLIRREMSTKKEFLTKAYLFNVTFTFTSKGGRNFCFSYPLYVEEMPA